jgi:hypothetical protein
MPTAKEIRATMTCQVISVASMNSEKVTERRTTNAIAKLEKVRVLVKILACADDIASH